MYYPDRHFSTTRYQDHQYSLPYSHFLNKLQIPPSINHSTSNSKVTSTSYTNANLLFGNYNRIKHWRCSGTALNCQRDPSTQQGRNSQQRCDKRQGHHTHWYATPAGCLLLCRAPPNGSPGSRQCPGRLQGSREPQWRAESTTTLPGFVKRGDRAHTAISKYVEQNAVMQIGSVDTRTNGHKFARAKFTCQKRKRLAYLRRAE